MKQTAGQMRRRSLVPDTSLWSIGNEEDRALSNPASAEPKASERLSRQAYHRRYDESGEHVELIEGRLYRMTPSSPQHASAVNRLARRLMRQVDEAAMIVRTEQPLHLGSTSDPEPGLALVRSPETRYDAEHPGREDVLLIIEVSESSVRHDRTIKLPLYAEHEIQEVWILNLRAQEVEVFRDPVKAERRYTDAAKYTAGPLPQPLAAPGLRLAVADVLPSSGETR